jgi:hypothetical protein
MRRFLTPVCLLVFFAGLASTAAADSFTTSSCGVDFAVNDGGSFYVRSSQIPPGAGSPPGLDASSSISGADFHLEAGGAGYSDSGIVLYFNGSLKLGDLKSVTVSGTVNPATINLWLDTGGDGKFFAFDGNGMMTGLNNDTYGSGGVSLDTSTPISIMAGNGAGGTYTLAQLQAGAVAGINVNTRAALWIGITNTATADISGVSVWVAGGGATLRAGGDRLAATQNADGGWGWPLTGGSQQNTIGPIAMGLAKAYSITGGAAKLSALQKAGVFLLAKTNTFSPPDGYLAAELDKVFGGNTYRSHVMTYYYNPLAAGTYNRNGQGTLYDTAGYINYLRSIRVSSGIPNLAAWDVGMGLVGAASCGASTSEWINGVKSEINELDGSQQYDVIGLAGAVYGLAFVNESFDPTAGEHAAASSLGDLAAILASYQINNGGFADNKNNVTPGHEAIQETDYAVLALEKANRSAYLSNIQGASDYLTGVQMATGGWGGESGGNPDDENNEVTGEALWATSAVHDMSGITSVIGGASYCQPAVEFETRIGQGGLSGDWELGHKYDGTYLDTSGQFAWQNNESVPFTLSHDMATGVFKLSLGCGPSTTWSSGRPGEAVTAIWLVAKSSDVAYTGTVGNLSLNGSPVAGTLTGNNAWSNMRIYGRLMGDFTLTGTINFSWSSGTPQHSQIEAMFSVVFQSDDPDGDGYVGNCGQYTVTPSAGANGSIDPSTPRTVGYNETASFTVSPAAGYHAVMSGTCGGSLVGSTYTTNPITADCTVIASFAIDTHTVTPSAGPNGTIAPSTPQTVNHNATASFTVLPAPGYIPEMSGTCGGSLIGTTYTTGPVTADCTVVASFTATAPLSITTSSLPSGFLLTPYSQTLSATGGIPPYNWSISSGALPNGLTINSSTGEISGIPTTPGTFSFTVQATDAISATAFKNLSIVTGTLPIRYGDPGQPINYDQIIQSAYDQCADGYVIEVQALDFPTDVTCDRNVTVTLKGGFDEGFTGNPSYTTITGALKISDGKVLIENIVVK